MGLNIFRKVSPKVSVRFYFYPIDPIEVFSVSRQDGFVFEKSCRRNHAIFAIDRVATSDEPAGQLSRPFHHFVIRWNDYFRVEHFQDSCPFVCRLVRLGDAFV